MSRYKEVNGIHFRLGSMVYSKRTAIINMGSATNCYSARTNLCDHDDICYGLQPEQTWKSVLPFREKQGEIWRNTPASAFVGALKFLHKTYDVERLRVNEVADLSSQEDVDKLNYIADNTPVILFGYTANWLLDYKNARFNMKMSHHFSAPGLTGRAILIHKGEETPEGFLLCPKSAKKIKKCDEGCGVCFSKAEVDVAFIKHGQCKRRKHESVSGV